MLTGLATRRDVMNGKKIRVCDFSRGHSSTAHACQEFTNYSVADSFSWWPAQAEEVVSTLTGCEDEARKGHTGIWIHGDPGSESDEEEAPQKSAWGRR